MIQGYKGSYYILSYTYNPSKNWVKYWIILIKILLPPGSGQLPQLHISYKPQKISPKSQGLVRQLLHDKIRDAYIHPQVIWILFDVDDVKGAWYVWIIPGGNL